MSSRAGTFHHPDCAKFETDDSGEFSPMARCNCDQLPADDLTAALGDTVATIAPRQHFSPVDIEGEVLKCCKTGSLKVRVIVGADLEGKTLLVPASRAVVMRRAS